MATTLKLTISLFLLLAVALGCASSARILDEAGTDNTSTLPIGQSPVDGPSPTSSDAIDTADPPLPDVSSTDVQAPEIPVAPINAPAPTVVAGPDPADLSASADVGATAAGQPQLSFFMHNILGGTRPSARVVTGIIAASGITGVPFSKASNNIFPLTGGVPLANGNLGNVPNINGIVNNNNLPFIAGLSGARLQPNTVVQNTGNNNLVQGGNNQPFVTAGQLPAGSTLEQLMFGSITVFDDELTEGHELGSAVIGQAQGFYMASSLDGTSHTVSVTVMLNGKGQGDVVDDTISLFGVHRTATEASQVAVIGGTGKFEHAKGYATMESLQNVDSHTTDGVDTVYHFSIYMSE